MKLGLVCNNKIRDEVTACIQSIGIELFQDADLFVVEEGLHQSFSTCVIFSPADLDSLASTLKSLASIFNTEKTSEKIIGLKNEEYYMLDYNEILFFEANDSNVYCHSANSKYVIKGKLYNIENSLPRNQFVRINRSFIVNINSVKKIIPWFNRRLLLQFHGSKKEVEVSKNYVTNFKTFLGMR